MLLYDLVQNSGNPLQGTVFVAVAELVVVVAVPLLEPPIWVNEADVDVLVDCESEVSETDAAPADESIVVWPLAVRYV